MSQSHIDYVIDLGLFAEICDRWEVSAGNRAFVQAQFDSYRRRIAAIESRLEGELEAYDAQAVLNAVKALAPARDPEAVRDATRSERRKLFEEMIETRHDPAWDAVTPRLDACLRRIEAARAEAETAVDEWRGEFATTLELGQSEQASLCRFIRRRVLDCSSGEPHSDFEMPVDVLALAARASLPSAEIDVSGLSGVSRETFQLELHAILFEYEMSLDAVLLANRAEKRRASAQAAASIAVPGDAQYDEIEQQATRRWLRRFDVSKQAIDLIEALVSLRLGPDAAGRWRRRVNDALCPELSAERWPSKMTDWLADLPGVDQAQADAVEQLQREYSTANLALVARSVDTGIKLHSKRLPPGWSEERRRHLLNLIAMHRLTEEYVQRLCALLTRAQRARLADSLAQASRDNPRSFGPRVGIDDLLRLGLNREHVAGPPLCR